MSFCSSNLFLSLFIFQLYYFSLLARAERLYNDRQFSSVLARHGIHLESSEILQLRSRGFILNDTLVHEFRKHYHFNIPVPPKSTKPSSFSGSIQHSTRFCCECKNFNLNCPVCEWRGYRCEKPYHHFSPLQQEWFEKVFQPDYYYAANLSAVVSPYSPTFPYFVPWYAGEYSAFYRVPVDHEPCRYVPNNGVRMFGAALRECSTVIFQRFDCPTANISRVGDGCDWLSVVEIPLSNNMKACIAPFTSRQLTVSYVGGDRFCSKAGNIVRIPIATSHIDGRKSFPFEFIPTVVGYVADDYIFSTIDDSDYLTMLRLLNTGMINDLGKLSPYLVKIVCSPSQLTSAENIAFNGHPSWLGDILLQPSCSRYLPLRSDKSVCETALRYNYPFCPDSTFSSDSIVRKISYSVSADVVIPYAGLNLSCSRLDTAGHCFLSKLLNSTQFNLTEGMVSGLNYSLFAAVHEFVNALGRNETDKQFLNQYASEPEGRLVGNWISSIFGALIAPFFEACLSILVEGIFPPIIKAATTVLVELATLLDEFIKSLDAAAKQLAVAIADLVTTIFNLFISLLLTLESVILLFEYTIVFLLLFYYIKSDVVFCSIIVLILMIVIGIKRRSPSILLYFVHPDFSYFSLEDYHNSTFDYSYSLTMYSRGYRHVFYFCNASVTTIKLY